MQTVSRWTWWESRPLPRAWPGSPSSVLATLNYRRSDEATLPIPGPRWWVPLATAAAVVALVCRHGTPDAWHWLLPTLPVALLGPWLTGIDLDVLPDRLMLTLGVASAGVTGTAVPRRAAGVATARTKASARGCRLCRGRGPRRINLRQVLVECGVTSGAGPVVGTADPRRGGWRIAPARICSPTHCRIGCE